MPKHDPHAADSGNTHAAPALPMRAIAESLGADRCPMPQVFAANNRQIPANLEPPWWVRSTGDGESLCLCVEHPGDLKLAAAKAVKYGGGPVLVQHAPSGSVYRALGFKAGNTFQIVAVLEEGVLGGLYRVPLAWTLPCGLEAADYAALAQLAQAAGEAIPFGSGLLELEIVGAPRGPIVADAQWLPNPDALIAGVVRRALGIDLRAVAAAVSQAATPRHDAAVAAAYIVPKHSGYVLDIHGVEAARAMPHVAEIALRAKRGDAVRHVIDRATRGQIGYVIADGPTRACALGALEKALDAIEIERSFAT